MNNIKFNIIKNDYNFEISDLLEIGGRLNNPKRNFLFISKVLGKHLLVEPNVCKSVGYLLADTVYKNNDFDRDILKDMVLGTCSKDLSNRELDKFINPNENVLVIGFAETATALGMAVSCAIKDSYYVTTTRELIKSANSFFNFEEEHSHATSHKCYLKDLNKLKDADRIILVDDEITTGNTMLNLIKEFNKLYPNKKYTVLSILDFRGKYHYDNYEKFKEEHNLDIDVKSIISANIENTSDEVLKGDIENYAETLNKYKSIEMFPRETHILHNNLNKQYLSHTGRFGISFDEIREIENYARDIACEINKNISKDEKICVLGHGEDMYIPSRIANYIEAETKFKTTTRSPIFVKSENEYPIKERTRFTVDNVNYYFYNKSLIESCYDKVLLISEVHIGHKLTKNSLNIKL